MTRDQELKLISIGLDALMSKYNYVDKPKITRTYNKIKKVTKTKRVMSAAGRKRIQKAMKERWAQVKKQGGNSLG